MLQRLLIDKMENRILVGITMFVGVMILFGWVAINEQARMASFVRQQNARAIEQGAEKFALNCATCHGEDGRGLAGQAPALNSPHFFGYDFFAEFDSQLETLNNTETRLSVEREALSEELAAEDTGDERKEEIEARLSEIEAELEDIETQREPLRAAKQEIVQQLQSAVSNGFPIEEVDGEIVSPVRLAQVNWSGSLEQYIITTLNHGRPGSDSYWDRQMVAWAQRGGGPLRDDQVRNIAAYILNWDKGDDWTIEDALAVNQYARVPGDMIAEAREQAAAAGGAVAAGDDVAAILEQIEAEGIEGDPVRGEALYLSQESPQLGAPLGCNGCHVGEQPIGPNVEGTWDRVLNERLTVGQFEGYTPEQYIIESILLPGDYVVPGYTGGLMPAGFGERLTVQDLADMVAYLETKTEE